MKQYKEGIILIIDDTSAHLQILFQILTEQGYKVRLATDGPMGLSSVQAEPPDLILLDIMLPEMDGYQVCAQLKADKRTCNIPVIFISALDSVFDKVKAFSIGGVDYITKPFQVEEVLARVETHLTLHQVQTELEEKNVQLQQAKETAEATNTALTALNALTFAVNNSLDLEADLEHALEIVRQELNLEGGWLFLPEDNGRLLRLIAAVGMSNDFLQQETLTPVERCMCSEVLATCQQRQHFDESPCRRLAAYNQKYPAMSIQHVSLPVVAKQKAIGVLNLSGDNLVNLSPENYAWLEAVAQQMGNAIENATLYQNVIGKAERLSVLSRISTVVSLSWQLDEVLPPLLREMARVLETSLGVLVLRSEAGQGQYQMRTRFGRWQSSIDLHAIAWNELPLLNIIQQTQAPLLISRPAADERLKPLAALIAQENIQTVLSLPLIVQSQLTGFIQLYTLGQPRLFEATEIELARTLTNQAAVAIEKARLYEATVARYEQELEIARQIQQNLLPRTVPEIPGLRLAGVCQPAYETGGDFYDYVVLPDHKLGIVVGDVTGKSLPAAMVMALARNTVRSELVNHALPAEAMTRANNWLYQDIRHGTFVATVQAVIDPVGQRMWLVNAGQTATLLVRNGQVRYLLTDEAAGFPLGVQAEGRYIQTQVSLRVGDTLLFYTDGIVEAKNEIGQMFSFDRLEAALQRLCADRAPLQIIEGLLTEMQTFVGETEQHDDITLVVVQVE